VPFSRVDCLIACRRGFDDVCLPVDDARLPPVYLVYPCTCARSRRSHVSLLPFACAVDARRLRPFAMFRVCRTRDLRTLVNRFSIIVDA
jgi:hypothetical protein